MKEELQHRSLVTLKVAASEVQWMDDHEIWINNSMFDISSKKLENGIYTFTGLYDKEETLLVKKEREVPAKNAARTHLLAQFFKHLPIGCAVEPASANSISRERDFNLYNFLILENPLKEILTPPPQCS